MSAEGGVKLASSVLITWLLLCGRLFNSNSLFNPFRCNSAPFHRLVRGLYVAGHPIFAGPTVVFRHVKLFFYLVERLSLAHHFADPVQKQGVIFLRVLENLDVPGIPWPGTTNSELRPFIILMAAKRMFIQRVVDQGPDKFKMSPFVSPAVGQIRCRVRRRSPGCAPSSGVRRRRKLQRTSRRSYRSHKEW